MSFRRQHIRNARATIEAGTPLIAEYVYDTDLKTIRAGDGATLGGLLLKLWGKSYTVSPSQITANQNNYSPTDLSIGEALILDLDADRTMTGLAGGAANREVTLYNKSAYRLTLAHESASSTAGNRFTMPGAVDVVVRPYQSLRLLYSAATSRWIVIGAGAGWLGVTDLPETVAMSGDVTPAQITSNQNDYNPTGWSLATRIRASTDASRNLTGLAGGADGRIAIIVNVGSNSLVLKDADTGSSAANRFDFGADCTLGAKQVAALQYDATDSRWKMLANTAGAAVADGAVTAVKLATSAIEAGAVINGYLDWSVSGNALTVALKTLAGTDPTASDPVRVRVRSATATDGKPEYLTISAALSVTASSGSSLGANNTTAFRIWAVLFNDAGTPRLGLINCLSLSGVSIYPLGTWPIASSTAEGGAGAADSAQTFYTGTAVASKPYAVVGFASWETGLATAGTWASAPTRQQIYAPGVPLPGAVVQPAAVTSSGSSTSSTTDVDVTNATLDMTMSSAANAIEFNFSYGMAVAAAGAGQNSLITVTALRGATALSTTVVGVVSGAGTNMQSNGGGASCGIQLPNSASAQTFKLQHKTSNAGGAATTSSARITLKELMT